jgi:polyferredoxin
MTSRRITVLIRGIHAAWITLLFLAIAGAPFHPHIAAACTAIIYTNLLALALCGFRCPLTVLEHALRRKAGEDVPEKETFIGRLIERRFGVTVAPQAILAALIAIAVVMTVLSIVLYGNGVPLGTFR